MRTSGIFLHITSLPSPYGIGTLGKEAFAFVDFLKRSGQHIWQILPLGPVGREGCYSPYLVYSAFAGNPLLIDLDLLVGEGYLLASDLQGLAVGDDPGKVDFPRIEETREILLHKAYCSANEILNRSELEQFRSQNGYWLDGYADFMVKKSGDEADYYIFLQYLFFRQWGALKDYANQMGIKILGDIPFYVPTDSADYAANREIFLHDRDGQISIVAGVPPDVFSSEGQLWGYPLYDWSKLKSEDYGWWMRRIGHSLNLFDIIRIDHFLAFDKFYAIPANETSASNGTWLPGPGIEFFARLKQAFPDAEIVAEDLGVITRSVRDLLNLTGYAGMTVLQFAFDSGGDNPYLPHNHVRNSVVFTGTHDNNTTKGWLDSVNRDTFRYAVAYLRLDTYEKYTDGFIRAALESVADTAIIPMADWLDLGENFRMNTPGTTVGNWTFRALKPCFTEDLSRKIVSLTGLYGRI